MKRTFLRTVLLTWLILSGFLAPVQVSQIGPAQLSADPLPSDGVVVYQFHRRFRCQECYRLEEMIKSILEDSFAGEMKSGELVFRVIDLDQKGSERYEKKYDFFYNTVIIVDREDGKDLRHKNLEILWQMLDNEKAVADLIKDVIGDYLLKE